MSLQLFNTPLAAAWQSSRNKISKRLRPIWKLQKVTFSLVVPNLQNLSIQSSLLQKSAISPSSIFLLGHFWKESNFFSWAKFLAAASAQLAQNLDLCQNDYCTCVMQPFRQLFAFLRPWRSLGTLSFVILPCGMQPIWQSPIFLFGLDHMWSYMSSTTLLFKSKLVHNCLNDARH